MRYVVTISLPVAAILWIGADYGGFNSESAEPTAQSSTCVPIVDSAEDSCRTLHAAVLSDFSDGDQHRSQRSLFGDTASATQSAVVSHFEHVRPLSGDIGSDIHDVSTASAIRNDSAGLTVGKAVQYIGEFSDPDTEEIGSLPADDVFTLIGDYIDPSEDSTYEVGNDEQIIGVFANPDVDA